MPTLRWLETHKSVTSDEMYRLLRRVPYLEVAHFFHIEEAPYSISTPAPAVDLLNLRDLIAEIYLVEQAASPFLLNLHIPSLARVLVRFDVGRITASALERATADFFQFVQQPNALPRRIEGLSFFHDAPRGRCPVLQCSMFSKTGWNHESPISLSYRWVSSSEVRDHLGTMIRHLPLENVWEICWDMDVTLSTTEWRSAFRDFIGVETLVISKRCDFSTLLKAATPHGADDFLFPKLQRLVIWTPNAFRGHRVPLLDILKSFIEGRTAAHLPVAVAFLSGPFLRRLDRRLYGQVRMT